MFQVTEADHHGELTMVDPVMASGIAMMGFVVVVIPNSAGQMALSQGCLFERLRRRVIMSLPCLMFVGWRLLPASDSLGN